jgi:hypothetical protein
VLAKSPGMHRFIWDMRYASPGMIEPEYSMAVAFGENTPLVAQGPLVLPGEYQIRLTVGGQIFSQPLRVELDPRVHVSIDDLIRQFQQEQEIFHSIRAAYHAYRQAREFQRQLERFNTSSPIPSNELKAAADALGREIRQVIGEEELRGTVANRQEDVPTLRSIGRKLAAEWAAVDSADAPPTIQLQQAFQRTRKELEVELEKWQDFQRNQVTVFNALAEKAGTTRLTVTH